MCPTVFEANVPELAYRDAQSPEEAHQRIRRAREQSPIAMGSLGPEILSYDLVRTVLFDSRFCVAKGLFLAAQGITSGRLWDRFRNTLMSLDGTEHHRLRRLAGPAFGPRSAARLETTITEVITSLLDPLTTIGGCDVVDDIARRYPSPVIGALLGAPAQDWRLFSDWADDIFQMFTWNAAAKQDVIMKAYDELDAYIVDMVARRRDNLGDDFMSDLIRAGDSGDKLTHDELCRLVSALLIAGTDTTRNQLAAAVQVLCDHPKQWALLGEHPELAPNAVAELVRHTSAIIFVVRQAVEEVELAGVVIPAGTQVVINFAAANRDPDVYDDPERLDITREVPVPALAFGAGIHNCLGAHLARAELTQALTVMTRRMRNPRRTGPAPWKPFAPVTGPATLPIEFDIEAA
ncbi:Mycinamicin IV hydroxylase/epoxidase [Mycobacterium simulans]|uniref:Mycinamicin IV hydroxylase/epoxidase n=1 Tax=Mycobacterium simulans TaxID=627089 RepID=A0A7Z7NAS1_9MYCO|nr:cytochrome P450 [Mycobacterium simulans]SOJ55163.1 Mycinamicin IV hydroxylase/epoxidase [Mycobacterium simulans]